MDDFHLSDLLDLAAVQKMATAHYKAAGMPIGIIDALDGSNLVGAGWQEICTNYHRANPESLARCQESDNYIKQRLEQGQASHYKCKNGLWDIGIPIIVAGRHLATLYLGQFFYESERPERKFFEQQAQKFGYDLEGYMAALDRVPVFKRERVDYILEYDKALVTFLTDLAEQSLSKKKSEIKLRESREHLGILFEQASDAIYVSKTNGRLVNVNQQICYSTGYSDKELLEMNVMDIDAETTTAEAFDTLFRRLSPGQPVTIESTHRRKDGSIFPVEIKITLLQTSTGPYILGIARDITKRKRAEEVLQKNKAFVDMLLNAIPIPVFYKDKAGRYLGINQAFERYFGTPKESLVGKTVFDIHPPELAEVYHTKDDELLQSGGVQQYDSLVRNARGELRHVIFNKAVFADSQGFAVGLIGAIQDITERKRAEDALRDNERRYKKAQRIGKVGNWEYDIVTETFWVSDEAKRIYGLDPGSETFTTEEVESSIAERERVHQALVDLIEKNKSLDLEFEIRPVTGPTSKIIKSIADIIRDETGSPLKVVGVIHDITERKLMEKRLQQAQKMEAIGNLAGGIAHDFNNILFPIVGLTELLLEDLPPDSNVYDSLQEILKAGKRASALVKQILAFSRQSEHQMMPVRIQQVLKEVLKLSRSTIPSNIEIAQDVQNDCGPVMADPTQLHQIAMNLITNAYHAVEQSGGKISVTLSQSKIENVDFSAGALAAGEYAVLSVTDTGSGIDPDVIEKIFEPYFTTKSQDKGTGLGLAVVYGIVKEYNGDIKVRSEAGKGAQFDVYLPLIKRTERAETLKPVEKLPIGIERILLVDDEEPIAQLEKLILERLGYRVTSRVSSVDALEAFKTSPRPFDLVITDMSMPNMTGDQLAEQIHAIAPQTPIIVCTGFSERLDQDTFDAMGIKAVLMKPIIRNELARTVRKVLDESKSLQMA